jgi:hypothetical protein
MVSMHATVEMIRAQRASIDPAKVFLTILAALFFAPGWAARKVVIAIWWVVSYAAAGVMVGWRAAAPDRSP